MNYPSMCIPKTPATITRHHIIQKIEELKLGEIEKCILVPCTKLQHQKYQRVYIYFKQWNEDHPTAVKARSRLLEGKDVKVFYDDFHFWKIFANHKDNANVNANEEKEKKELDKKNVEPFPLSQEHFSGK